MKDREEMGNRKGELKWIAFVFIIQVSRRFCFDIQVILILVLFCFLEVRMVSWMYLRKQHLS